MTRDTLLEKKFYYTGHSARWFFQCSYKALLEALIPAAMVRVENPEKLLTQSVGIGVSSTVHTFLASFESGKSIDIISQYVSRRFVFRTDLRMIRCVLAYIDKSDNPLIRGWAFEMAFFTYLRYAIDKKNARCNSSL